MSRSVDLFIAWDRPLEEMAEELGRLTRFQLQPGDAAGTWSLDESDVHAELHSHPYIDDGELLFERYPCALSARVAHGERLRDAPETALLRVVAEALRLGGIANVLVHDLQYREEGRAESAPEGGGEIGGRADAAGGSRPRDQR